MQSDILLDTQDRKPKITEKIDRVGIEGLRTNLKIKRNGDEFFHLPIINVMIDLDGNRKGIHMSRLTETINEVVNDYSKEVNGSLEDFGKKVLQEIAKKHHYERGEITIKSTLIIPRITPVSNKSSYESYGVSVKIVRNNGDLTKQLGVSVIGSSLCPHSLETTGGKAHVQRAKIHLNIDTDFVTNISLEKMIEICERSLSSPTYTVLKTEDEKYLVNQMFENPKFVEDLARECFNNVRNLGIKCELRIKAISYESIHKHNAVSVIQRRMGDGS